MHGMPHSSMHGQTAATKTASLSRKFQACTTSKPIIMPHSNRDYIKAKVAMVVPFTSTCILPPPTVRSSSNIDYLLPGAACVVMQVIYTWYFRFDTLTASIIGKQGVAAAPALALLHISAASCCTHSNSLILHSISVLLDHLAVPKVLSVVNLCNTCHQCKFQHAAVSYDTFRTPFAFDITIKLSSRVTIMLNPA